MKSEPPSFSESADYELEQELSGLQKGLRFLRSGRGIVLLILFVSAGVIFFRGGALYTAAKEWRMRSLVAEASQAQAEGKDDVAFSDLRRAYILTPGHLEVLRAIAQYHSQRREAAALAAWQQVVETKGASLEDEVAWCREALRLGSLKVIRDQIGQWEKRPEVQKDPGVLAIAAEMQSITGHREESLRLAREAVIAATGKSAELSACRLSLARVLLMVRDTNSDAAQDRGEALGLLRDVALGHEAERRDAIEILLRFAEQPAMAPLLKQARLSEVVSHMAAAHDLPESLKVDAWDLRLAGCDAAERRTVVDEFARSFRADQPGGLEAARWLLRHREFAEALKMADPEMQTGENWFLAGMDALAGQGDWAGILHRLDPAQHPPLAPSVVDLFTFRVRCELGQKPDAHEVWRNLQAKLNGEPASVQLYVAGYAEQMGYADQAAAIYRGLLVRTQTPDGMHSQSTERRNGYLGLVRSASATMTLDDLTALYAGLVREFPDMDEAQNDLCYLQLLQHKGDHAVVAEVTQLLDRRPEWLTVRSTLALALLREGRAQAAADVYTGWQIDWASASDRCKAVRVAVLDAAGQHTEAEHMRSALVAANLRAEEKQLAGIVP